MKDEIKCIYFSELACLLVGIAVVSRIVSRTHHRLNNSIRCGTNKLMFGFSIPNTFPADVLTSAPFSVIARFITCAAQVTQDTRGAHVWP